MNSSRTFAVALFLILWLSLQSLGSRFLLDPGTFWHVTTGQKILQSGFLNTDPYTFTHAGVWWIPYQWLGEIIMAVVHGYAGMDGILALSTAIVAGLMTWLGTRFHQIGLHPIFVLGLLLLALAAVANHLHARPLLGTMVGMAILMHTLQRIDSGQLSIQKAAWLIPMFAIWTNIHGGMLGGLATLYIAVAGWIVAYGIGYRTPVASIKDAFILILTTTLCTFTMFASPYGYDLPKTWLVILQMPKLPGLIVEHARYDFMDSRGWPMLGIGGLYLFALAGLREKPRITWLIPLAWFAQALLRVRHGSLFTIVTMVTLAEIWPHTRWAQWLSVKRPDVYTPRTSVTRLAPTILFVASLCLFISTFLQRSQYLVPLIGYGSAKFDDKTWPLDVLDVLKANEPRSPGEVNTIFNDYSDGGFIIYHTPGYKVFVDDRCEVFGDDWLEAFVRAGETQEGTEKAMIDWQEKYGKFRFALTRTDTEFDKYFHTRLTEWELLKRTDVASFYRRK